VKVSYQPTAGNMKSLNEVSNVADSREVKNI